MDFYKIGELKLGIDKGQKTENDYTLHWYGSQKFTDLELFNKLCDNINTKGHPQKPKPPKTSIF